MKIIKYLLAIVLFFVCVNVFAIDSCSTSEIARLKELANNVEIKYDYDFSEYKENGIDPFVEVDYNINIVNMTDDLKIYYKNGKELSEINLNELDEWIFSEGETAYFEIHAWVNNLCVDSNLRTIKIEFPHYNSYYYFNKDKCNNSDFEYCKEFLSIGDKTFAEIDKLFTEYLKKDKDSSNKDNVYSLDNYLVPITIVGGLIVVLSIVLIIRKSRKNKLEKI